MNVAVVALHQDKEPEGMGEQKPESILRLESVRKSYGAFQILKSLDLEAVDGEFLSLLGPSGCGKTTTLRIIAGFERPDAGVVTLGGQDITVLPPNKRDVSTVFQDYSLFPHMTVAENVAFGLVERKIPKTDIADRVSVMLDMVRLGDFASRKPAQLSGGQKQRVALARSLVLEPKILLLDEPFASLDQHLRERLREEVRDIQQRLKITTLFVTHGQDEALALADRIVVMRDGRTEQAARPDVVYREPATPFVAGFIGTMNLVEGAVANGTFTHSGFTVPLPVGDGAATLAVRPEALEIVSANGGGMAKIHRVTDYGTHAIVDIELPDGTRLKSMTSEARDWSHGQPIDLKPRAFAAYRDNAAIHRSN